MVPKHRYVHGYGDIKAITNSFILTISSQMIDLQRVMFITISRLQWTNFICLVKFDITQMYCHSFYNEIILWEDELYCKILINSIDDFFQQLPSWKLLHWSAASHQSRRQRSGLKGGQLGNANSAICDSNDSSDHDVTTFKRKALFCAEVLAW